MAAHQRVLRRNLRENLVPRVPRVIRDRTNPLENLSEHEVFLRYRFRPDTIMYIVSILPNLSSPTRRNSPIPALLQVLITLRFIATGAIHLLIGDTVNVSRSTVGRVVRKVSRYLQQLSPQYIQFPRHQQANDVKSGFSRIAGNYQQNQVYYHYHWSIFLDRFSTMRCGTGKLTVSKNRCAYKTSLPHGRFVLNFDIFILLTQWIFS